MFFSQQVFNEIATSECLFDSNNIKRYILVYLLPRRCSNGKKIVFLEVAKSGQSPKCLSFSMISLFFLFPHCALHFLISLETPPQSLLL